MKNPFFSEVGMDIIIQCMTFDRSSDEIQQKLAHPNTWKEPDYNKIKMSIVKHESGIDSTKGDLEALKRMLIGKRPFLWFFTVCRKNYWLLGVLR